jgi:hypothetical protein
MSMSMTVERSDMIDVFPETHKLCEFRDFTFANAVRPSGTANLSFFRRCARERVRSQP